jgi:hypothetical protein
MGRASRFVIRSVARLVWARSVRGLVVLLLGGVIITLVVRAVEGQSARDPVTQPPSPQVASGDSSDTGSLDGTQVAMALTRRGGSKSPTTEASYVTRIPEGSATYTELDAARMRWKPGQAPDLADSTYFAQLVREWLTEPRKWGRVSLPSDVGKALGDPEVYIMSGGGDHREIWALRQGRYYPLPLGVRPKTPLWRIMYTAGSDHA